MNIYVSNLGFHASDDDLGNYSSNLARFLLPK
jgi:hypothetical protein